MAEKRRKKESKILAKSEARCAGMRKIDPNLDFGDNVSVVGLDGYNTELRAAIEHHNGLLSELDVSGTKIKTLEKKIGDLAERLLSSVAGKWGKDSDQYELAGGVRKSERKRPVRRKKTEPVA